MWWTGNSCCFIGFCETFLVLSGPSGDLAGPPRGAIIILPWRTNQKVEGSSVAFILRLGSRTMSAVGAHRMHKDDVYHFKKNACSGSQLDENFFKLLLSAHTHIRVYLHARWRVFPCVPVCEHLPVYTVASPDGKFPWGEKPTVQSSSSDFTLMMLFVWWSLWGVRRLRRSCSARIKEPQWKIDKGGCLKDEQELRSETQRGLQHPGVHQWRCKKQMWVWEGPKGGKGD